MALSKHRDERDVFGVDFADELDDGESITGTPVVQIIRSGVDVSSQFLDPLLPPAIGGSVVAFWLIEARAADEQGKSDKYKVYVRVETDGGRILVAQDADGNLHTLTIHAN